MSYRIKLEDREEEDSDREARCYRGGNTSGGAGSGEASKRRLRRRRARERLAAISVPASVGECAARDSAPPVGKAQVQIKHSHQSVTHTKEERVEPGQNIMRAGRDEVDRSVVVRRDGEGVDEAAPAAADADAARLRIQAEREAKKFAKRLAKTKASPLTAHTPSSQIALQSTDKNSNQPKVTQKSSQITDSAIKPKVLAVDKGVEKSQKKQGSIVKPEVSHKGQTKSLTTEKSTGAPQGVDKSTIEPQSNDFSIDKPHGTHRSNKNLNPDVSVKVETTALTDKLGKVKLGSELEVESTKSKAELRAERRAKQEAQRAAKQVAAAPAPAPAAPPAAPHRAPRPAPSTPFNNEIKKYVGGSGRAGVHRVNWFQHLYSERERSASADVPINCKDLHPAVVRLGAQLSARVIVGSNARCVALLHALKQVVSEYSLPARTEFARGLEAQFAASEAFLRAARPPAASMTNAIKHLRWQLTQLPNNISEFDAKCQINEAIDTYIRDQIEVAGDTISIAVRAKISHGDNILTYGCSSLVEKILKEAWSSGLRFRAVVVGGAGGGAGGRELLRRLLAHGVPAAYLHISALSFVMRTVHKVVLGAASLLGNGWVLAGAGTAQVALAARACNVPVLVCCETHKFSERVQTDAFVYNEIGEPDSLAAEGEGGEVLRGWRQHATLTPLALTYDVTPPTLVTAVVTELAVLPCTSAPVVLRFKLSENAL